MEIASLTTSMVMSRTAKSISDTNGTESTEFADRMESVQLSAQEREQQYIQHLRSKYGGHFRIESIGRDEEGLRKAAGRMSGDDVIIAPNMVTKMAQDPEVAAYYEGTIDECFARVPQDKMYFAAKGLTFEPCGVVVHEDGIVTYICGGGDTPEKVAQVNAINAARDAKRAERRRQYFAVAEENAQQLRDRLSEQAEMAHAQLRIARSHADNAMWNTAPAPPISSRTPDF